MTHSREGPHGGGDQVPPDAWSCEQSGEVRESDQHRGPTTDRQEPILAGL
jgi:hypothetical protein